MTRELAVLLGGRLVGVLSREKGARLSFRYDRAWQDAADAYPLSLSMPYSRREHPHEIVDAYLRNLLPDNDLILERWGRRFHVSPRDASGLLEHVGEDCTGAVQFCLPERIDELPARGGKGAVEWLSEAEIADYYALWKKNPQAARWVVNATRETCARAGEDPQLARDREELGPQVQSKMVLEYPYMVYFRRAPAPVGTRIQAIRILHQARDVETALAEDEPS